MENDGSQFKEHDNQAISLSSLYIQSDDNAPDTPIDDGHFSDKRNAPVDTRSAYSDEDGSSHLPEKTWMFLDKYRKRMKRFAAKNREAIVNSIWAVMLLGYIGCLSYACYLSLNGAAIMLSITGIVLFCYIYAFVRDHFGDVIREKCCSPATDLLSALWNVGKKAIVIIVLFGIAIGLYFLCRNNLKQLVSAVGLVIFVFLTFITSKYPKQVKWRPVIWGLALQIIFAFIILQTDAGFKVFDFLGDVVHTFLNYSDEGSKFVFGDPMYLDHRFAFQTVAPLLIKPMVKDMTISELHAVMTGGFATIAGTVLGAYISFGISASHLLSASVMSAPAALAIAKLSYPETEESKFKNSERLELPKGEQRNVIEAASHGAATAIPLVLNIAANLMAFIAVLALLNGILGYLGALVGVEQLSFEIRSEILATYALCGFGNLSSIGIQLGGLTPLAPERAADLANVAVRALIAGTTACFMTACVAGVLLADSNNSEGSLNFRSTTFPTVMN
ncbi:Sodium/nucleoside cotransporter 2 [Holothuria leucospilota]|uniref:Sodium/nucleoside cotransporter 2 n=1 Tax=Holothuria leucospilota TaxID=206669 RepID=A0A9Q1BSF0_HOLLE|nr:Sodium/nucleoside cotransporter 2 [Holothuria leucospilota]